MQSATITITNPTGLHARPASLFVQTATKFQSKITIQNDAKSADAKSMLKVLTLGTKQGMAVTLTADGPDENEAIAALVKLIESNFGE